MNDLPEEFARFPAHWNVLPFTDAIKDATSGNKKLPKQKYSVEGRYPVVDQGQAQFGGYTDEESLLCKSSNPTIVFGDHTRAFKYVTVPFVLGADGAKVLEPKIENLDKRFLFHYLKQLNIESAGYSRHFKFLKETFVPVPPLEEQKRIAAILDKADAIRQKRKQAINLADEFLRSVFLDMFGDPVTNPKGWEERKLITGLSKVQSGWSAKGESYPCASNELGVLKVSAVTSGYFKEHENKFVSREIVPEGKSLLFPKKGDLLFSRANTRELVAATCIVTRDYDNVFLPDKLWKVEPNEYLMPEFLHMLIQQPRFKERLTSQATGSSGSMLNISKSKFEQTMSIFPSIEEQIKFKDIYWKVMKSLASLETSETKVGDFFNSLSQKAFSGQL